jgi:hypothetical protein
MTRQFIVVYIEELCGLCRLSNIFRMGDTNSTWISSKRNLLEKTTYKLF